jgi:hypothetical protein
MCDVLISFCFVYFFYRIIKLVQRCVVLIFVCAVLIFHTLIKQGEGLISSRFIVIYTHNREPGPQRRLDCLALEQEMSIEHDFLTGSIFTPVTIYYSSTTHATALLFPLQTLDRRH